MSLAAVAKAPVVDMSRFSFRCFKQSVATFASPRYVCHSPSIRAVHISVKMESTKGNHKDHDRFSAQDNFLSEIFKMSMKKAVEAGRIRDNPVVRFKKPEELQEIIDFKLPAEGVAHSDLLDLCSKVFEYSVLTGHPRYFNQQIGGLDVYGFAGEIVTSSLTTNGHTFEISPVFNVAEVEVLKHIQKFAGFSGEGTFCPGGTYSNMLAMNLARIRRFPDSRKKGICGLPTLVTYCSEQAHYSAQKNSNLLGFGEDNCISVKCDKRGKMIPEELEKEIIKTKKEGGVPLFVTATAGTTVLGAFDPFHDIADICKRHDIWMHIDGAWGGSALLSKKHKHLCNGVERADSLAWNFHKMASAPIQCSVLLVQVSGLLKKSHSIPVPYIFQEGKPYDESYDFSRNLVQCGRRVDAFKLWLMWKAKGDKGMEDHVDRAFENADYLVKLLKSRPNFRLVIPQVECTNVPFWYIPPSLRGLEENEEFFKKLSEVVPVIKTRMQKSGKLLVGFSPTPDVPAFFRMTVMNELVEHQDMDYLLDEIERRGEDL